MEIGGFIRMKIGDFIRRLLILRVGDYGDGEIV